MRSSSLPYFSQRPLSCQSSAGTDRRQQHLLRAGAIHLLADDALDLAQHAHAEGQEVVDATRHLADHRRRAASACDSPLPPRPARRAGSGSTFVIGASGSYIVPAVDCTNLRARRGPPARVVRGGPGIAAREPRRHGLRIQTQSRRCCAPRCGSCSTPSAHSTLVRAMLADATAHAPALWRQLADLGLLGILVPAEHGGQGGTLLDLVVVLEEMGSPSSRGRFFATTVLGGLAIALADAPEHQRASLPALASGARPATLAVDVGAAAVPPACDCRARGDGLAPRRRDRIRHGRARRRDVGRSGAHRRRGHALRRPRRRRRPDGDPAAHRRPDAPALHGARSTSTLPASATSAPSATARACSTRVLRHARGRVSPSKRSASRSVRSTSRSPTPTSGRSSAARSAASRP